MFSVNDQKHMFIEIGLKFQVYWTYLKAIFFRKCSEARFSHKLEISGHDQKLEIVVNN